MFDKRRYLSVLKTVTETVLCKTKNLLFFVILFKFIKQ